MKLRSSWVGRNAGAKKENVEWIILKPVKDRRVWKRISKGGNNAQAAQPGQIQF